MRRELVQQIQRHTGYREAPEAEAAVEACLAGISRMLPKEDAEALAEAADTALEVGRPREASATEEEAYRVVSNRLGVAPLRARELMRTLVATVPTNVDDSLRRRLAAHLPESLAELLVEPDLIDGDLPTGDDEGPAQPLTKLDEKRAHRHSVVREANPHEKTKISSGRGTGDVREGSIATGRPTSSHPLSNGTRDDDE